MLRKSYEDNLHAERALMTDSTNQKLDKHKYNLDKLLDNEVMLFKEDDFLENLIMEKLKQEEEAKLDEKRRVLGASNP